MKKNAQIRRLLSMLLALTILLTLCGCGDRGSPKEEEKASEGIKPVTNVSGEEADAYMHNDAVIVKHYEHNRNLDVSPIPEREAGEFHMYIANTETMTGFTNSVKVNSYRESIQCIIDTADDQFGGSKKYGHFMSYVDDSAELTWGETVLDEKFTRDVQTPYFYEGNILPDSGALPVLIESGSPFKKDGISVLVSNFVEPGFDVSCISAGIKDYFDSYPKSGAYIIGFTSDFEGEFHVPRYNRIENRNTSRIYNFSGEVPCYIVVVGPLAEVAEYTELLFKRLDSRNVKYYYDQFSNNVHEELFADPLDFNVIPDIGNAKTTAPVLDSYNTGTLTERESGNAYFTTSGSATARDVSTVTSGISITKSSQIALISSNYDGHSNYDYDYKLYVLDQETGAWTEASKNAESMVHFTMEPKMGALEGLTGTILTSGREEIYVSTLLDYSAESTLYRDTVYRLEVRIHLNQNNSNAGADNSISKLANQSITNVDYFSDVDKLCAAYYGNYIWTGSSQTVREKAEISFRHTPNLDSLLISLSELEGRYESHTDKFTYLDFVFNIKDKNSKR